MPKCFMFALLIFVSGGEAFAGARVKTTRELKQALRDEFSLNALDKTDEHSAMVLENLLLLREGILEELRPGMHRS